MNKAVIYARYSSDSQTEKTIEGQLRVYKEFAERKENLMLIEQPDFEQESEFLTKKRTTRT